jgi:hypothetical protein
MNFSRPRPFMVGALLLVAAGCSGGQPNNTADSTSGGQDSEVTSCAERADKVIHYGDDVPVGMRDEHFREQYLVILHMLQRDCPDEAKQAGLWASSLPPCQDLTQEDCFAGDPQR